MNPIIECSYCDGKATIEKRIRQLEFKKEKINVVALFYKCAVCNEEFTTIEVDTITVNQLHNQYRELHRIPFPEEIMAIREKYGLSAAKISEVLGLGVNGYSNYEKGEIPSLANANLIKTASKPASFLDMIEEAKGRIGQNSYRRLKERMSGLIKEEGSHNVLNRVDFLKDKPKDITGFSVPNKEKIENIIIAFIRECNADYNDRLKINKLLFYADFLNYKNTGKSITGLCYRAINYGPVPCDYDVVFDVLLREKVLVNDWVKLAGGKVVEIFMTEKESNMKVFNDAEKECIFKIIKEFKNRSTWDLVQLSHKEKAWKENNSDHSIISFQRYAFDLAGIE